MKKLEVRIPISCTDSYINRVHLIAHSIRSLGGHYADANIRVTVGDQKPVGDLRRRCPCTDSIGVNWHILGIEEFKSWEGTAHPYIATMMERFRPPFTSDYVLMLDADVLAFANIDDLLRRLAARPAIAGMMAHVSPFQEKHRETWSELYRSYGLGEPEFTHRLSGWGLIDFEPGHDMSPPYYNTGVLVAPSNILEKLYDSYISAINHVRKHMDTYFFEQIALTIAMEKEKIDFLNIDPKFNFPNDPAYDKEYVDDLADLRFLHYLRTDIVDRDSDFASFEAVDRFVERDDLLGSNEALRRRVKRLLPLVKADREQAPAVNRRHENGVYFDHFIENIHPSRRRPDGSAYPWPGDEWASEQLEIDIFRHLFSDNDLQRWARCLEFGPGSGKYTEKVLNQSKTALRAYDVSDCFLRLLRERCSIAFGEGRLTTRLIDWESNRGLLDDLDAEGWSGTIDAVFGLDVFIHVDLQSLVVYLLSIALVLKQDGKLIATFADPLSTTGLAKVFNDVRQYRGFTTEPSSKFHWISDATIRAVFDVIGFRVDALTRGEEAGLDVARLYVVATLSDPSKAESLRHLLG